MRQEAQRWRAKCVVWCDDVGRCVTRGMVPPALSCQRFEQCLGRRILSRCWQERIPYHESVEGISHVVIPCWIASPRDRAMEAERSRRVCLLHLPPRGGNQRLCNTLNGFISATQLPRQREGDPLRHRLIGFQDHCQITEALGAGHLRLLARPDAVPERLDHRDQPTGVVGTLPGLFGTALLQSEPGCPHLERGAAACPGDRDPGRGGTLGTDP